MSKPEYILNIETSTSVCSVTVSEDNTIIALRESRVDRSHASLLTVLIAEAMRVAEMEFSELSAVAVSKGPGSYTGLRIGVSAAKGICYASDLPLIATDTLKTMAMKVISLPAAGHLPGYEGSAGELIGNHRSGNLLLCPMIDARRMEVYTALFDAQGSQVKGVSAEIIDESGFAELLAKNRILFFGDGADKCKKLLNHPNAIFLSGIYPSAIQMAGLSHEAFREGRFEDTAYFEPFYLKDFIATTPKNKMI